MVWVEQGATIYNMDSIFYGTLKSLKKIDLATEVKVAVLCRFNRLSEKGGGV